MNAFGEGEMNAYWFGSGTPTYLIEMLRKFHVMPQQIGGRKVRRENFDAPVERMMNVTPLRLNNCIRRTWTVPCTCSRLG